MTFATLFENPVALMSTLAVGGTILVLVYLIFKLIRLINTTHSED